MLLAPGPRTMSSAGGGESCPLVPRYWFSRIAFPVPERTETPFVVLKPMVFAAPIAVPPIVLFEALASISTPIALARLVPLEFVPIRSPRTTLPVAPVPLICTPAVVLKPNVFALEAVVPPMVLPGAPLISTPTALARLAPLELVPIRSPRTTLPVAPAPLICTPAVVLKPNVFADPVPVPPIVLLTAPLINTPTALPRFAPLEFVPKRSPRMTLPVAPAPLSCTPAVVLNPNVFADPVPVPPIVLLTAPLICTPTALLRFAPLAFVPKRSPSTTLPVAPAPLICTPAVVLKPNVFADPVAVPPIVLLTAPLISTPTALPRFAPLALVPNRSPTTTLPVAPAPLI